MSEDCLAPWDWTATSVSAAKQGDFRAAYRLAFRSLEMLMLDGDWTGVDRALLRLCDQECPADLGIGSLRFASDAAPRISVWNEAIEKVKQSAAMQGMNDSEIAHAMRGLLPLSRQQATA